MLQSCSKSAPRSSVWFAAAVGSFLSAQSFFGLASRPVTTAQIYEVQPTQTDVPADNHSDAAFALTAIGVGIVGFSWARSRPNSKASSKPSTGRIDRHLLLLLHQDRAAAERLIAQMQRQHPEKSRDWCIDKVKYDLGRDRH
ncbi:MAG TPA: hypothetical protein VL134_05585 [Leptolyngbya sp.]|jgi:hypothetical protein|nr:hypothetical protein [Leptolyngbya sp.]